jgi:hypothetical protein
MIHPVAGIFYWETQAYLLGTKLASETDPVVAYNLAGRFYVSTVCENKPWGLLSVPNALVRGTYDAMAEPGIELPLNDDGQLNACCVVFYPDEIAMIGGPDVLTERGHTFHYTIGRLVEFEPAAMTGVSLAWGYRIFSPELQALRRSYGLSSLPDKEKAAFSILVAVRRRGVLGRNETSKLQSGQVKEQSTLVTDGVARRHITVGER